METGLELGPLRRLGIAFAAGFRCVWMPLFPTITVALAGVIGGTARCAATGSAFLGRAMSAVYPTRGEGFELVAALMVSPIGTVVWALGAIGLGIWAWPRQESRPVNSATRHAVWSGLVGLGIPLIGMIGFSAG